MQTLVCRIIFIVPIYSFLSCLSIYYPDHILYFNIIKDLYEAYVIYIFTQLIVSYLGGENQALRLFVNKRTQAHLWPLHRLPQIHLDERAFRRIKKGVLQTIFIKPVTSVVAVWLEAHRWYEEGNFGLTNAYPYIWLVDNLSMTLSIYAFLVLYAICHDQLECRFLGKFICVKGIIFFSYWQTICVYIGIHLGYINAGSLSPDQIHNSLLCIEMAASAVMYWKYFHHSEFRHLKAQPCSMFQGMGNLFNVTELIKDARHTFITPEKHINFEDYNWDELT